MARIINKFIKGTVGPYTFKEYRGQQLLVSKPGKGGIRQTQNTIEWSGTFGKASSFAAAITDRFKIQLGANSDGSMVNSLVPLLFVVPLSLMRMQKVREN